MGDLTPGKVLFIASGDAGKVWGEGAQLGEQKGAVMVNNIQVCFSDVGLALKTDYISELGWINVQSKMDTTGYSNHLRVCYKAARLGNADLCRGLAAVLETFKVNIYLISHLPIDRNCEAYHCWMYTHVRHTSLPTLYHTMMRQSDTFEPKGGCKRSVMDMQPSAPSVVYSFPDSQITTFHST